MSEEMIVKDQAVEEDHSESSEDLNDSSNVKHEVRSDSAEFPPICHRGGIGISDEFSAAALFHDGVGTAGPLSSGSAASDNNGDHAFEFDKNASGRTQDPR